MNKFDILFRNGIEYQHNRNDLTSYFIREFLKEEEKNKYTVETFFLILYDRIEKQKEGININYKKNIDYYKSVIEKAKRNELVSDYYSTFKDKEGIDPDEYNEKYNQIKVDEIIKYLEGFTIENVISQRWNGLKLSELKLIEENLKEAEVQVKKFKKIKDNSKRETEEVNPYPEIFKDYFSFMLFERLYQTYKDNNRLLADFSFIYRMMHKQGFILEYQKPEMFKLWLSKEPFNIVIDANLKQLHNCTTSAKTKGYNDAIELVKNNYKNVQ